MQRFNLSSWNVIVPIILAPKLEKISINIEMNKHLVAALIGSGLTYQFIDNQNKQIMADKENHNLQLIIDKQLEDNNEERKHLQLLADKQLEDNNEERKHLQLLADKQHKSWFAKWF